MSRHGEDFDDYEDLWCEYQPYNCFNECKLMTVGDKWIHCAKYCAFHMHKDKNLQQARVAAKNLWEKAMSMFLLMMFTIIFATLD